MTKPRRARVRRMRSLRFGTDRCLVEEVTAPDEGRKGITPGWLRLQLPIHRRTAVERMKHTDLRWRKCGIESVTSAHRLR